MTIEVLPVLGDAHRHVAQSVRSQMLYFDPEQNQESRVVSQVADIAPPCFCTPTNVAVACTQMARRTRPRHSSSLAVIVRRLEPIFITMGGPLTAHRNTTLGQSCG